MNEVTAPQEPHQSILKDTFSTENMETIQTTIATEIPSPSDMNTNQVTAGILYPELDHVRNTPTMFGTITEGNVVFCVDTSGSMYNSLDAVKEHLVEFLLQRARREDETAFNLIEFSNDVTQWANEMVQCTPQTVAVATDWIKQLEAKTGTNTMDALMTAFRDDACDAVCLVTDGHPDQNPTDILDSVCYVSQNRPVHCIYLHAGEAERSATEFLQDLAMETYGSFHVVAITLHGCIEKITPVYRAEAAAERIIRTTDRNIYPSNHKFCSVTTSLNGAIPHVAPYMPIDPPLYPYYLYPYPLRHYYQHQYPDLGWSRYRPSRAGLKYPQLDVMGSNIPGPGATLIGRQVLARRNADGNFYLATVKSQILANKFLVEFGPTNHGKYKTTSYQETYVYDLVAHTDALRHSVCTGDQVLAPWQPEGDIYAPGVVIQGQERRVAQGGIPDSDLIVSFHNGKSCTVARDTACWIPRELHERITFEIKLPRNVRCEFAEQDKTYPEVNLPGYPTSGPKVKPVDYHVHESGWLGRKEMAPMRSTYNPFYVPIYPVYYQPEVSGVVDRGTDVIPGTGYTKAELNEKIMSQLMRHKMLSENDTEKVKLLRKRQTQEENTLTTSLEKSVTFKDPESDLENEVGDLEMRDSGWGSSQDLALSDYEDAVYDERRETCDVAVGADHPLLYRRKVRRSQKKPPWRYWNSDPTPELLEPMHEGPYRMGPYEEAIPMVPILNRSVQRGPYGVEWGTCMTSFADHMAKMKMDNYGVADSMHMPKPPDYKPEKQLPGRSVSETIHGNMSDGDRLALYRQNYRREKTLERENEWHDQRANEDRMASMIIDNHHSRIEDQLNRDHKRYTDEQERVHEIREAKKQLNEQIRTRVEGNQERERDRDDQRIEALRVRRERRDDIRQQRAQEIEQIKVEKLAAKQENTRARWERTNKTLNEQEARQHNDLHRAQSAKQHRYQQFQKREEDAIKHKQVIAEMNDHRSAVLRSRIFP